MTFKSQFSAREIKLKHTAYTPHDSVSTLSKRIIMRNFTLAMLPQTDRMNRHESSSFHSLEGVDGVHRRIFLPFGAARVAASVNRVGVIL